VFGVELEMTLRAGVDLDAFLDAFLCDAVEANGLFFGGGGQGNRLGGFLVGGFLELGRWDVCQAKLTAVVAWLAAEERIEKFVVGEIVDASI
jgi:uncharacterized protein